MTPAERLRKNQRLLDKAIRELDQQRVKLEKQEKTLVAQIKQSAQKNQLGACKIQAKDLVRTRRFAVSTRLINPQTLNICHYRYIEKFYGMRSQLQKISLRLQVRNLGIPTTAKSSHAVRADLPDKRTNDASNERGNCRPRQHEQNDESPFLTADCHGVREGERRDGAKAGDDGRRN